MSEIRITILSSQRTTTPVSPSKVPHVTLTWSPMFFSSSILNVIGSLNPSILGWTVTMIPSFFVGWEQNCIEPLPWSYFLRRPGNLRSLEHFRLKINFPSESIAIISHWSLTLFNEEDLHVLTWYQRKVNYYCINTFSDIFIAFGTFPRISRTLKLFLLMLTIYPRFDIQLCSGVQTKLLLQDRL